MKYTLKEIEDVMKSEGIGKSSTRYVLDRLKALDNRGEVIDLSGVAVKAEIKKKPTFGGVTVSPQSNNNVTFEHYGEKCQLHFLGNGNIAVSKDSNKWFYLEIDKDQLLQLVLPKF